MIIDMDLVNFLNETSVTEAVSSEINMLFGVIFVFIGIVLLNVVFNMYKKKKRSLRKIRKR